VPEQTKTVHCVEFEVRDHECDLQGVVNNAVYQNYLEHARHRFLLDHGVDFVALSREGRQLVLVRAELDYRRSLRPQDRFRVETRVAMEGRLRMVFHQRVVGWTGIVHLEARMVGAMVGPSGRPMAAPDVTAALCPTSESPSRSSVAPDP